MLFPYIQFQDLQIFCSQDFPIATTCKSKKGGITRLNIFEIMSKVTRVIYTLDQNSMPDITSLSQAVFTRFLYSHHACVSLKRGITRSNNFGISSKVKSAHLHFRQNCIPNIMSLACVVLQIVCSPGFSIATCISPKRGITRLHIRGISSKVIQVILP